MTPAQPGADYSREDESQFRRLVQAELRKVIYRGRDIELAGDERLILVSPDGTRYELTVDNAGNLGTTGA